MSLSQAADSDGDTDLAGGLKLDQITAFIRHGPPVNELKSKFRKWLDSKLSHSRETEREHKAKPEEILQPENDHCIAALYLPERKAPETGEKPVKIVSSTIKESANEHPDERARNYQVILQDPPSLDAQSSFLLALLDASRQKLRQSLNLLRRLAGTQHNPGFRRVEWVYVSI